jgi:hypothetical protein
VQQLQSEDHTRIAEKKHWYYGWPVTVKWLNDYRRLNNMHMEMWDVPDKARLVPETVLRIQLVSGCFASYCGLEIVLISRDGHEEELPQHDVPGMEHIKATMMLSIKSNKSRALQEWQVPPKVMEKLVEIFGETPGWAPEAAR